MIEPGNRYISSGDTPWLVMKVDRRRKRARILHRRSGISGWAKLTEIENWKPDESVDYSVPQMELSVP